MGPDNKRILLAAAVSVAILMGWQLLFPAQKPATAPPPPPGGAGAAQPAQGPEAAKVPAPAPAAPPPGAPEELVTLDTGEFRATFTTWGGALRRLELKGKKFQREEGKGEVPMDLVHVTEGEPWPLALVASAELGGSGDPASDPGARSPMRIAARDERSVTFEGAVGAVQVRKVFRVGEKPYQIDLALRASAPGRKGELHVLYPGFMPPDAPKPSFLSAGEVFATVTPACRAGEKTSRGGDAAKETLPGAVAWAGLDQHYFVSAILPQPASGECTFYRGPMAGALGTALKLPFPGELDMAFKVFAGPKQLDLLRSYGRGLDTAVDYGAVANLFAFFARILLWVLRIIESFVRSWGVAIILLTVLVKLLLYPLTAKSMRSMNEMRKLQPEIEKIKEKLGDDKEKMNLAVMKLYQEHKVNPLGGCLPMLLQMPIWFALYASLSTSVELYREPFLWLKDLTQYDPIYVLPLAMGASSFLMQKLSPQPADNAQAKMLLYFMPVFFTFIMLKLPSGLTLYILVNNLLSIAQQQILMRRSTAPAALPAKAKK